jgi:hypothetical protein
VKERVEIRIDPGQKARWQALARARGLTLTAFIVEAVEGSALPASVRSEIEHQLQRVPSEIKTILHDDDLLTELLQPLVAAKLQGFDPERYRSTLLAEVRQAVRAEAAQFASGERQADDGTGWMDDHA